MVLLYLIKDVKCKFLFRKIRRKQKTILLKNK